MPPASAKSASSGSDSDPLDQRKRKRMESNRESARRSRMRKQQHLGELTSQVAQIKDENSHLASQISVLERQLSKIDSENAVLTAQVVELNDSLKSLNSVLRCVKEFGGVAVDIPDLPDPLLRPWRLPCPSQLITASAKIFQ
ncbi:basic region/leucine zipper motif 53 [Wolffia australiana]